MSASSQLSAKLKQLPMSPGVYFYKDRTGEIIYIGKAAKLRNRVRQYFQTTRQRDPKTDALVREIADLEWMVVDSEIDALFLEAEQIRRYLPRYNILLRDDKALAYVRIDYDSDYPTVSFTRRPLDDGARYFGPYSSMTSVRQALRLLRRVFPYAIAHSRRPNHSRLYYQLGLDPGLEEGRTSLEDYRANLRRLMALMSGKRKDIIIELEHAMNQAARRQDYEQAARIRNQLDYMKRLSQQIVFSDKEFSDLSKDQSLGELVELLGLERYPKRIEGYDISHMQGSDVVASMVVFTNGVSNKAQYRKFKTMQNINNDFFNMGETIFRRFSPQRLRSWGVPDLILIDGGKGQLDAAIRSMQRRDIILPCIGLAKRQEQIVLDTANSQVKLNLSTLHRLSGTVQVNNRFAVITLPHSTNAVKLLQRVRDESHRFAVSYHSTLKTKRVRISQLSSIPGIGPVSQKSLLRRFGSAKAVYAARPEELEAVVGRAKTQQIQRYAAKFVKL